MANISKEELAEVVSTTVKTVIESLKGPPMGSPEERFDAFSKEIHPAPAVSTELVEKLVPCKSPLTKATFVAKVVKSRTYPLGRVVELVDYRRPDKFDVQKVYGGLAPDGIEILKPNANENDVGASKYTDQFNKWAWAEFWQKDLNAFVGHAFQPHTSLDMQAKIAELTVSESAA
jgi:hypothetical protein